MRRLALPFLSLWAAACSGGNPATPDGGDAGPTEDAAVDAPSTECTLPPRKIWTWEMSIMPPSDVQVMASCRAMTDHAYIFVADDVWDVGKMTQAQVDTIATAFEKETPADKTRGMYKVDVDTFGDPPDVDGDPHIYLFYQDMKPYKGNGFDGFFRDQDQKPGASSNMMEMLHLNATGKAPDSEYMLGVVIHELVHLINWKYDVGDEGWLMEMLAESAMTLGGYFTDAPSGKKYVKLTSTTPLCVTGYSDYGATFSWGSYMLDRFGPSVLRSILQDKKKGIVSIEANLGGPTFKDTFGEFMVANLLDQPGIGDGRYGFKSIDQNALGGEQAGIIDSAPHSTDAVHFGARFVRFNTTGAGTLALDFNAADFTNLTVHSVTFDPTKPDAATIKKHTLASASEKLSISVLAGQVVDLVVAVAPPTSLDSLSGAPKSTVSYTASFP